MNCSTVCEQFRSCWIKSISFPFENHTLSSMKTLQNWVDAENTVYKDYISIFIASSISSARRGGGG